MDNSSSAQSREELERKLQHMKQKYEDIQRKLQKSVKRKKGKEHVQRKLAEQARLQLAGGDASPVKTYRSMEALSGSGSFCIGALQLDDSLTENPDSHQQEEGMKLTRKCASLGRLKMRRSVSFVLNEDDATLSPQCNMTPEVANSSNARCIDNGDEAKTIINDQVTYGSCSKYIDGSCSKYIDGFCSKDIYGSGSNDIAGSCSKDIDGSCSKDIDGSYSKDIDGSCSKDIDGSCSKDNGGSTLTIVMSPTELKQRNIQVYTKCTENNEKVVRNASGRRLLGTCNSDIAILPVTQEDPKHLKGLPEAGMCVEETQDLSQMPMCERLCNRELQLVDSVQDGSDHLHVGRSYKSVSVSDKLTKKNSEAGIRSENDGIQSDTELCTRSDIQAINSISTKSIITEHNVLDTVITVHSSSLPQTENHMPETFSDPGPITTRSRRRRTRRSREITVSDISMKDVLENSQSSLQGNHHTWIEGLIYPVEYYVRKTRSMSGKDSQSNHSKHLLPDGFGRLGRVNKRQISSTGRSRQTSVSLQELVASSQGTKHHSTEDVSLKTTSLSTSNVDSASLETPATTFTNTSQINTSRKTKLFNKQDEICVILDSNSSNISSPQFSDCLLEDLDKEILKEIPNESQSNSTVSSSQSSNSSGSRNFTLSRRKRRVLSTGVCDDLTNFNQHSVKSSIKADIIEQQRIMQALSGSPDYKHDPSCPKIREASSNNEGTFKIEETIFSTESGVCQSTQKITSKQTILPTLSSEIRSHILKQTRDFVLPDSDFVELKLTKAKLCMKMQSPPEPFAFHNDKERTKEPPVAQINVDIKHSKAFNGSRPKALSSNLPRDSHLVKLANLNELHSIETLVKGMSQAPKPVREYMEDRVSEKTELVDQRASGMNLNVTNSVHGLEKHVNKPTTHGSELDSQSSGATVCQESLKGQTDDDYKKFQTLKATSQASVGVLESQFSQSQFSPRSTSIFRRMGRSPGSPTSEDITKQSPTSSSEIETMSFSPQGCSPTNSVTDVEDVNNDTVDSQKVHPPSDQDADNFQISAVDHSVSITTTPDIDTIADGEFSLNDFGVITPPMTAGVSGNPAITSPFADVATATPYGKAEMPHCQSQCDPQVGDEHEEDRDEEMMMSGMKFAGCLKHDFQDFPSPIIGISSCTLTRDAEEVACLVVYSINLVVLWMTSDHNQWQIQASWAVLQQEEIVCIQMNPCSEANVLILNIGGHFLKCCARVLRYNSSTGAQHQLELSVPSQHEDAPLQDMCTVSPDTLLVLTKSRHHGQQVYKFNISPDFRSITCCLLQRSLKDLVSLQRVQDMDDMAVMISGQELLIWDLQSECILQRFSLPVDKNLRITCLWASVQSGVLFVIVGFQPTAGHTIELTMLKAPCVLLALNPATGKSATLHQYEIPGNGQDSQAWFTNGAVAESKLAVTTSDGHLLMWDLHSAQPLAKTTCSSQGLHGFNWALTQEGSILTSDGSCVHIHRIK